MRSKTKSFYNISKLKAKSYNLKKLSQEVAKDNTFEDRLNQYYIDSIDTRTMHGKYSESEAEEIKQKILSERRVTKYIEILKGMYYKIRFIPKYQYQAAIEKGIPHDLSIEKRIKQDNNNILAMYDGYWVYRNTIEFDRKNIRKTGDKTGRASLSVVALPEVIDALDELCMQFKYMIYKAPARDDDWLKRTDPITIYFYNNDPSSIMPRLKEIGAKYDRSKYLKSDLWGKEVYPGLALDERSNESQIMGLIDQADSIDPDLATAVRLWTSYYGEYHASPGQILAIQEVMKMFS